MAERETMTFFFTPFFSKNPGVDRKSLLSYDGSKSHEGTCFNLCIVKCKYQFGAQQTQTSVF